MTCLTRQLSLNLETTLWRADTGGSSKLNHVITAWLHQCLANPLHWIKVRLETLPDVTRAEAEGADMSVERAGASWSFKGAIKAIPTGRHSAPPPFF